MSSQLYPNARELFLTGQLSWLSGTMKALLLPETYNFDPTDVNLEDIFSGVRVAVSSEITGRTADDGVANCDPIEFGLLVDNRIVSKLVIFKDTGVENTSTLIAFLDEETLIGVPLSLIGFEYFFVPDAINGGIFRL